MIVMKKNMNRSQIKLIKIGIRITNYGFYEMPCKCFINKEMFLAFIVSEKEWVWLLISSLESHAEKA